MYGDEDLFLHEAIPGHHFQISLQRKAFLILENTIGLVPTGWALLQSLGERVGLYQDHINTLECWKQ
jgi:uncharacterized protein (DUF885 family)